MQYMQNPLKVIGNLHENISGSIFVGVEHHMALDAIIVYL